jgi:hypothetical protein
MHENGTDEKVDMGNLHKARHCATSEVNILLSTVEATKSLCKFVNSCVFENFAFSVYFNAQKCCNTFVH